MTEMKEKEWIGFYTSKSFWINEGPNYKVPPNLHNTYTNNTMKRILSLVREHRR